MQWVRIAEIAADDADRQLLADHARIWHDDGDERVDKRPQQGKRRKEWWVATDAIELLRRNRKPPPPLKSVHAFDAGTVAEMYEAHIAALTQTIDTQRELLAAKDTEIDRLGADNAKLRRHVGRVVALLGEDYPHE